MLDLRVRDDRVAGHVHVDQVIRMEAIELADIDAIISISQGEDDAGHQPR